MAALQLTCEDENVVLTDSISSVLPTDIRAAQQEDLAIKEVVSLKLNAWVPNEEEENHGDTDEKTSL